MPYKDSASAEACRKATRARNQAFVAEVNVRTFCAHCGAQPVEWHNPDHVEPGRKSFRISNMVNSRSIVSIQAEMDRCTPLCRRCHMVEDGRLDAFAQIGKTPAERICSECNRSTRHIIQGRCRRCHFLFHPPPTRGRTCPMCNALFEGIECRIYCSPRCRQRAYVAKLR